MNVGIPQGELEYCFPSSLSLSLSLTVCLTILNGADTCMAVTRTYMYMCITNCQRWL